MKILQLSLEKVTGLLRVGFGEAGANIIRSNLHMDSSSSAGSNKAVIDALLPGVRVYAIFGFCDIHHFEESKLLCNVCVDVALILFSLVVETHLFDVKSQFFSVFKTSKFDRVLKV